MPTAAPPRTAADLVAAIRAVTRGADGWEATVERVADVLRHAALSPEMLAAEHRTGSPDRALSRPVHVEPDGSFSVVAFVALPGQETPIHDHVTWCALAVLAGTAEEELFALEDGRLVATATHAEGPGTVTAVAPPGDIHRLRNTGRQPAISLHVYGTDVSRIGSSVRRVYDHPIAS